MYKGTNRKVSETCLSMTCKAPENSFSVTPWVDFVKLQQGNYLCGQTPNMLSVKSVLDIGGHFVVLMTLFCSCSIHFWIQTLFSSLCFGHTPKTLEHSQIIRLLTLHSFLSCNHESCVYCGLPTTWLQQQVTGAKTKDEEENCSSSLLVLWFSKDNSITNTESLCVYICFNSVCSIVPALYRSRHDKTGFRELRVVCALAGCNSFAGDSSRYLACSIPSRHHQHVCKLSAGSGVFEQFTADSHHSGEQALICLWFGFLWHAGKSGLKSSSHLNKGEGCESWGDSWFTVSVSATLS